MYHVALSGGPPSACDIEGRVPDESADPQRYLVVLNDEEQYSIWPSGKAIPAGWHAEGTSGTKEECIAHIKKVWTDMRPRSLRRAMDAAAGADDRERD